MGSNLAKQEKPRFRQGIFIDDGVNLIDLSLPD
jgi:hypothetical protein